MVDTDNEKNVRPALAYGCL